MVSGEWRSSCRNFGEFFTMIWQKPVLMSRPDRHVVLSFAVNSTTGERASRGSQHAPETFVQVQPPSLTSLRLHRARQTRRVRRTQKQVPAERVDHTNDRVLLPNIFRPLILRLLHLLPLPLPPLLPGWLSPWLCRRRTLSHDTHRCSTQPRCPCRLNPLPNHSCAARRCLMRTHTSPDWPDRRCICIAETAQLW